MMMDKKKALTQILGPEKSEMEAPKGLPSELHSCVEELISCIHGHDVEGALGALRTIFLELETEPHEEYSHEEG